MGCPDTVPPLNERDQSVISSDVTFDPRRGGSLVLCASQIRLEGFAFLKLFSSILSVPGRVQAGMAYMGELHDAAAN